MISGPSDVVDEGAGSGSDDVEDGISVDFGGVGTASDVDAVTSGGGAIEEEEEGCDEASGGGTMDDGDGDGDGSTELSTALDVVGVTEDDVDAVGVGAGISDIEDDGAGAVGVGSATSEDELAVEDDEAIELGTTGSGIAEDIVTSEVVLGSKVGVGVGMTVVYDVTITTGGT
jgi:hypothetical protein